MKAPCGNTFQILHFSDNSLLVRCPASWKKRIELQICKCTASEVVLQGCLDYLLLRKTPSYLSLPSISLTWSTVFVQISSVYFSQPVFSIYAKEHFFRDTRDILGLLVFVTIFFHRISHNIATSLVSTNTPRNPSLSKSMSHTLNSGSQSSTENPYIGSLEIAKEIIFDFKSTSDFMFKCLRI